jgi:hypothetical protein
MSLRQSRQDYLSIRTFFDASIPFARTSERLWPTKQELVHLTVFARVIQFSGRVEVLKIQRGNRSYRRKHSQDTTGDPAK